MHNSGRLEQPFYVKTCSLAAIATGDQANSLFELRDKLITVDEGCVYYHFWGSHLTTPILPQQYHNDFAMWAHYRLHDYVLAEKLSVIDPTEFDSLEELRQEVLATIEGRLDDYEIVHWTKREDKFHFIRTAIIIFESSFSIPQPEYLHEIFSIIPPSSIFYHFIDARTRTDEKMDDFSVWLKTYGDRYLPLIESFQAIDPYFLSLTQIREELCNVTRNYFKESSNA